MSDTMQAVRAVLIAISKSECTEGVLRRQAIDAHHGEAKAGAQADAFEKELDAAAAKAFAAGREPATDRAVVGKVATLRRLAKAASHASERLTNEADEERKHRAVLQGGLVDVVLPFSGSAREQAAQMIKEGINGLFDSMAQLIAADLVQTALIGERYTFNVARHALPWSGAITVERMVSAIPSRLNPDPDFTARIRAEAERVAACILVELKEGNK